MRDLDPYFANDVNPTWRSGSSDSIQKRYCSEHKAWDECWKKGLIPSVNIEQEAREWLESEGLTPVDRMIPQRKRSGTVNLDGMSMSMPTILAKFYRHMHSQTKEK